MENLLQQSMQSLNFWESTTPPGARASRTQVDLEIPEWGEGWAITYSPKIFPLQIGNANAVWKISDMLNQHLWQWLVQSIFKQEMVGSPIQTHLANQSWLSAGWGRAWQRGRRRRERKEVLRLLPVAVLLAKVGAIVVARGAIQVPWCGPRICTCTAVRHHQPPVYMENRSAWFGDVGIALNLHPSSHPSCVQFPKTNGHILFSSTLLPHLCQKWKGGIHISCSWVGILVIVSLQDIRKYKMALAFGLDGYCSFPDLKHSWLWALWKRFLWNKVFFLIFFLEPLLSP